jgi:hypothetical protein
MRAPDRIGYIGGTPRSHVRGERAAEAGSVGSTDPSGSERADVQKAVEHRCTRRGIPRDVVLHTGLTLTAHGKDLLRRPPPTSAG